MQLNCRKSSDRVLRQRALAMITAISLASGPAIIATEAQAHVKQPSSAPQTVQHSYALDPMRVYSAADISMLYSRPRTLAELLRNLKLALDLNLLLQPAFYSDANLLKFFDGASVTRTTVPRDKVAEHYNIRFASAWGAALTVSLRLARRQEPACPPSDCHSMSYPAHLRKAGNIYTRQG